MKIPSPDSRETEWSKYLAYKWGGKPEYALVEGSRVDIVIPGVIAYEVEWIYKWPESIGQSLFYSAATGLTGGVVLLCNRKKRIHSEDEEYLRCLICCLRADLKLVCVDVGTGRDTRSDGLESYFTK